MAGPRDRTRGDRTRSRAGLVAALLALPVALLAGVGVFWGLGGFSPRDPAKPRGEASTTVTVAPLPSPNGSVPSGSPDATTLCRALLSAVPADIDGHRRRPTTGDPERVAAWGDPPVVLRCGTGQRVEPTGTAQVLTVNGIDWVYDERPDVTLWRTVGRVVTVEITVPRAYRTGSAESVVNPLSGPIHATIPPRS